ncbi:MAG: sulfurtransferase, partial [Nitrospinaceae bacterium]|nr:sulfurtransferase [Nitrospinaceae bacterium]NIR57235.1 sulfurtransferase [Nitrospinaceae bacterium]NIS87683.1 sulfurtransferase [Nitrospinaceae bacterium]NIT84549.1 sulfurtransferase [Nitrospinaceae bacterium]NIU46735.1 sulfurtransferase [Nitrospinaceae bacterium]
KGGLQAWTGSGGEVERGTAGKRSPSQLDPSDLQLNPEVIADRHWIRERLGSPGLVLVDNRTAEEFQGATPYGSRRGGHIPHAVHIP